MSEKHIAEIGRLGALVAELQRENAKLRAASPRVVDVQADGAGSMAERSRLRQAVIAAFPLLRRIRDRVDAVQFFEADAVMGMMEEALKAVAPSNVECPACFGRWDDHAKRCPNRDVKPKMDEQDHEFAVNYAGNLADWCNLMRPALVAMMAAYERRIRSDCSPGQLALKPWECAEYIVAQRALDAQPRIFVDVPPKEERP